MSIWMSIVLSAPHGFTEISLETVTLRLENNVPMHGYVIVLKRL